MLGAEVVSVGGSLGERPIVCPDDVWVLGARTAVLSFLFWVLLELMLGKTKQGYDIAETSP